MLPILEELENRYCPSSDLSPPVLISPPVSGISIPPIAIASPQDSASNTLLSPGQVSSYYGFNRIQYPTLFGIGQGTGYGQTIAIVDAYGAPTVANDLAIFDTLYHIPAPPLFLQLNQFGGTQLPGTEFLPEGWDIETALDVEWAHALAPGANIVLVEANSAELTDLLIATHTASIIPTVSVVSMSWGSEEFASQLSYDPVFIQQGVTFVAASGDTAGHTFWPSVSPNVVSVGGTVFNGNSESGWTDQNGPNPGQGEGSGGGRSQFEAKPSYQTNIQTGSTRFTPDVAAVGGSLVTVVDTGSLGQLYGGVFGVYGTSAAAPQWAALLAIVNQGRELANLSTLDGATHLLPVLYSLGQNNFNMIDGSHSYNTVTGLGSPDADILAASLGAPVISSLPTLPNDSGVQQQLLQLIPSEQFWALGYNVLANYDPTDFANQALTSRLILGNNPMLYTQTGRLYQYLGISFYLGISI